MLFFLKKFFPIIALLTLVNSMCFSQGYINYNTSVVNLSSVNPAHGSTTGKGDVYGMFRSQTIGFVDAESGTGGELRDGDAYLIHGSFPIAKIKSAVGVFFSEQNHGLEVKRSPKLNLSHGFDLSDGVLGVGVTVGVDILKYNNGLVVKDESDVFFTSVIRKLESENSLMNVDAGLLYRKKRIYYGISVANVYSAKISNQYKANTQSLYVIGGYDYQTSNPSINIKPSFSVLKVINSLSRVNLNVMGQYNKFLSAGVSYTSGNNLALIAGCDFPESSNLKGLRFYGSYDFWVNRLGLYNVGSVDFTVGYSFNASVSKLKKTYKSVRFL